MESPPHVDEKVHEMPHIPPVEKPKALRRRSMQEMVIEKANLITHFKLICQYCAGSFFFWSFVAVLAITEPVLCSQYSGKNSFNYFLQVVVLGVSSILFIIQLVGVATREWDKIIMIQAMSSFSSHSIRIPANAPPTNEFSLMKLFVFFTAEGEYLLEFLCLVGGWAYIFIWPGIAALRCFRVFRLLWFYEVDVFRNTVEFRLAPILGREYVSRGFKVLKFSIKSLTALGNELFRLTSETRGALLLILVFSYTAFVLGTALWIETKNNNEHCLFVGQCTYTLMRLTFFDGDGFDFAYFLTGHHRIMFCVVMMYVCLTSFGILNGLVGIFGTVFTKASAEAFTDDNYHDRLSGSYLANMKDDFNEDGNDSHENDFDEFIDVARMDSLINIGTHESQVSENGHEHLIHGEGAFEDSVGPGGDNKNNHSCIHSGFSVASNSPRNVLETDMQITSPNVNSEPNERPSTSSGNANKGRQSEAMRLDLISGGKSTFVKKQLKRSHTATPSRAVEHLLGRDASPYASTNHSPRGLYQLDGSSSKVHPVGGSGKISQQKSPPRHGRWADHGLFAAKNLGGSMKSMATHGGHQNNTSAGGIYIKEVQILNSKVHTLQKKLDNQNEVITALNKRSESQNEIIMDLHAHMMKLTSMLAESKNNSIGSEK